MKTNLKFTLPMLALAATTTLISCSDNDIEIDEFAAPDPSKALIEFTSNDGNIAHRAALATRAGNLISFGGDTKIAMRIKSEGKNTGDVRYTVTEMKAKQATCSDAMHLEAAGKVGDVQNVHDHVNYLDAASYRYWDDAFGRDAKLSIYAIAVPGKTNIDLKSSLKGIKTGDTDTFNKGVKVSNENPNWFLESAEDETFKWTLTTEQTSTTIADQDICYSYNIRSRAENDETEKGVYRFYNNNGTMSFKEMKAGRLQWTPKDTQNENETVGKFDQGHLIFHHALSKVTINLTEATNILDSDNKIIVNKGFDNTINTDFKFANGTNVTLIDFPYENVFDLSTGDWNTYSSSGNKHGNITKLQETTDPTATITTRTVTGLVVPGKVLKDDTKNAMRFIIDDNEYFVTCDQIATAIQTYYGQYQADGTTENPNYNSTLAGFTTMKQGEHYQINITVAKTKIENITAQLVDWETVNANIEEPSNAYINIAVETRNDGKFKEYVTNKYAFDLYRAAEEAELNTTVSGENGYYNEIAKYGWTTGYTNGNTSSAEDKATKSYDSSKKIWSTLWTWPNNKTYYHFRMVGNTEGVEGTPSNVIINKDDTNGDYFAITSGAITGSDYKDYTWAAPFAQNNGAKWDYDLTYGFDGKKTTETTPVHQIYKAIGATDPKTNNINMMMFHMTSQIFFNVTTTTENNKVELRKGTEGSYEQTRVELLYFYKDGTVRVGNGLVEPTTTTLTTTVDFQFDKHVPEVPATGSTEAVAAHSDFKYGVVPQALSGTYGNENTPYKVGIRITTPDGNQYVINDLSSVVVEASAISSTNMNNPYTKITEGTNNGKYTINRWFPGYQYTYTVTIKKTGIESITAQLVDWETVKGDLGTITLEK